jgi:hypothetical protein
MVMQVVEAGEWDGAGLGLVAVLCCVCVVEWVGCIWLLHAGELLSGRSAPSLPAFSPASPAQPSSLLGAR